MTIKRKFLVPIATAVSAFLTSSLAHSTVQYDPKPNSSFAVLQEAGVNSSLNDRSLSRDLSGLVLGRGSSDVLYAGHRSHRSHSSHSSHRSHYSSR